MKTTRVLTGKKNKFWWEPVCDEWDPKAICGLSLEEAMDGGINTCEVVYASAVLERDGTDILDQLCVEDDVALKH